MSFPYTTLTYNGITKIVSNEFAGYGDVCPLPKFNCEKIKDTLYGIEQLKIALSGKSKLDEQDIIDDIIPEPIGGAHRDRNLVLSNVRESISKNLHLFKQMSDEDILDQRKNKFLKIGRGKGFITNPESLSTLENKGNIVDQFFNKDKKNIYYIAGLILLLTALMIFFL